MSRKLGMENGLAPVDLEEIRAHWRDFHQALVASVDSISSLHGEILKTGYAISISAFYAEIAAIPEGKGVVQNPVLLSLVCRIAGLETNRLFGVPTLAGTEVQLKEDEHKRIADAVYRRLHERTSADRPNQRTRKGQTAKASWLSRLMTVQNGFHKVAGQLRFAQPLSVAKAEFFLRSSIMSFPDYTDLANASFLASVQTFWTNVVIQKKLLPDDLMPLIRLATVGIRKTIHTLGFLSNNQRIHTVRVILYSGPAEAQKFNIARAGLEKVYQFLADSSPGLPLANDQANWDQVKTVLTNMTSCWSGLLQFQTLPRFNKAWTHNSVTELISHLSQGSLMEDIRVINDKVLFVTEKLATELSSTISGLYSLVFGHHVWPTTQTPPTGAKTLEPVFSKQGGGQFQVAPESGQFIEVPFPSHYEDEIDPDNMEYMERTTPGGNFDLIDNGVVEDEIDLENMEYMERTTPEGDFDLINNGVTEDEEGG